MAYNVAKNGHIVIKGVNNARVYNNTIDNSGTTKDCINILPNEANGCVKTDLKNNIFVSDSTVIKIDHANHQIKCDTNLIYTTYSKVANVQTTTYTFSGWQALNFDLESYNQDPVFVSTSNLWPTNSLSGHNMGAAYDDGLDITTDWDGITETPLIVTKQQGATWQIGAYVK